MNSKACYAGLLAVALAAAVPGDAADMAEPGPVHVTAVMMQKAVLSAVTQLAPQHPLRQRYRLALPFGDPLFPPDHLLQSAPGQPQDPALFAWLQLPAAARQHDVLIIPTSGYFWRQDGAEYSAQFIVHPRSGGSAGAAGTQHGLTLQILQIQATHNLGRRFHLLGRTGPGYYQEQRPALPSAQAAAELAAFLTAALESQQH